MNQISPIAETADSVTLRRADFEALLAAAEDAIDLGRTLFIVSSKSGGTLEPNILLDYFFARVSAARADGPRNSRVALGKSGGPADCLGLYFSRPSARDTCHKVVTISPLS